MAFLYPLRVWRDKNATVMNLAHLPFQFVVCYNNKITMIDTRYDDFHGILTVEFVIVQGAATPVVHMGD